MSYPILVAVLALKLSSKGPKLTVPCDAAQIGHKFGSKLYPSRTIVRGLYFNLRSGS